MCTHYSLNPLLPTPSKFRMNVTICVLEREKGQLIEVKRFLKKYCIIIVTAAAVVFYCYHCDATRALVLLLFYARDSKPKEKQVRKGP